MRKRQHKKLVHEGQYVAEVEIELIDTDEGWSPYLSVDDALIGVLGSDHANYLNIFTKILRYATIWPLYCTF